MGSELIRHFFRSAFLFSLVSAFAPAADAATMQNCAEYYKAVNQKDGIMAYAASYKTPEDMAYLNDMSKSCGDTQSKVAKGLRLLSQYQDVAIQRDLPNSQAQDPKLTDAQLQHLLTTEYNQEEKDLAGIRKRLAVLDHASLETVLHFMMKQQGDDIYSIYALEIVARTFPQEYDSYKALTVPGSNVAEHWDEIKDSYLNKKDPIVQKDDD